MQPAARGVWAAAFAAFAAGWLTLSWPWLSGAVTIPWDAKAHFYPQLQFLAQSLHRGEAPFWAPFVFAGQPQIADPQSLIFSAPYLLLALLDPDPSFRAADATILGMLGLGGTALLLLFRDRGWHPLGGAVAALAFAFGASAAWRIQHIGQVMSLAWWPVALWLLTRGLERGSFTWGIAAGIAAGLMALGRDQVAFLGLWLLVGVVLEHCLRGPGRRVAIRQSLAPLAGGALASILVVAIAVLLTLLLADGSNRPEIDYDGAAKGSLHPALLLTAVIPNLFGADGPFNDYWGPPSPLWGDVDLFLARNMGVLYLGAMPAALVALAGLRGALWSREIRLVTIACALMLIYALGRYTPGFRVMFTLVPGVDLFRRPADATFLVGALGAILAGYALHRWWTGTLPPATFRLRVVELALLALPFATGLALAAGKSTLPTAAPVLAQAGFCLVLTAALILVLAWLRPRAPRVAFAALIGWLVLDLGWNNGPSESTALPPKAYDALRPDSADPFLVVIKARLGGSGPESRLDRIELAGLGFHWPNASLVHRLHNTLGYNPVRLGIYSKATGAGDHAALPEQRTFAPLFPSYRSPLADLLGLRWIATGVPVERIDPNLRPGDLALVAQTESKFLYENPRALPRVLFAGDSREADFKALLQHGRWPEVDFSRTVLLPPGAAPTIRAGAGRATILSYRNTEILIEAETASPGFVVLNDPWHPWWIAEVDGQPAEILRANVLFRAVAVPVGRSLVRFSFQPFAGAWHTIAARFSAPASPSR